MENEIYDVELVLKHAERKLKNAMRKVKAKKLGKRREFMKSDYLKNLPKKAVLERKTKIQIIAHVKEAREFKKECNRRTEEARERKSDLEFVSLFRTIQNGPLTQVSRRLSLCSRDTLCSQTFHAPTKG